MFTYAARYLAFVPQARRLRRYAIQVKNAHSCSRRPALFAVTISSRHSKGIIL